MAHHASAKKRIRQDAKKRIVNRYYHKTARNLIRDIREETDKAKALEMMPLVFSNIDKLAKKNIIHAKKAANLKSKIQVMVNKL